jgi:hypothetical protein
MKKNQTQKKLYFTAIIVAVAFAFCFVQIGKTSAAEIYFGTNEKEVGLEQSFEIGVFLNTAGESLNAVASTLTFPTENLSVSEIRDGNSIVNMWVERPIQGEGESASKISFSGIIPGGYVGNNGYLFSIVFTSKKSGKATITSFEETMLLNDGAGTITTATRAPISLSILSTPSEKSFIEPVDTIKPESFTPKITRDPNLFDNQYFIAFVADDKQSGIDHFEVKQGFFGKYETVESPYVLKDQSLRTRISVKAVDKADNARVETVSPEHLGYKTAIFFSILIVIVAFIAYRIIRLKKHGKIF